MRKWQVHWKVTTKTAGSYQGADAVEADDIRGAICLFKQNQIETHHQCHCGNLTVINIREV
jgi:hypothetical protein